MLPARDVSVEGLEVGGRVPLGAASRREGFVDAGRGDRDGSPWREGRGESSVRRGRPRPIPEGKARAIGTAEPFDRGRRPGYPTAEGEPAVRPSIPHWRGDLCRCLGLLPGSFPGIGPEQTRMPARGEPVQRRSRRTRAWGTAHRDARSARGPLTIPPVEITVAELAFDGRLLRIAETVPQATGRIPGCGGADGRRRGSNHLRTRNWTSQWAQARASDHGSPTYTSREPPIERISFARRRSRVQSLSPW